ncbi:HEAT repeat domain-containing protein [Deinococcus sp. HMF7604]|uniref:HEAT repeat domain-containing protein n=1 Tax=Deinococcus betulae TaxID=2873312 RepID=UPI001CCD84BB|nr:HEAT repeat domain-containing protein [Deinococcus betulae]MBZ9751737.1 HEAT repeat domain-containing protein [Deinococcus betulae]
MAHSFDEAARQRLLCFLQVQLELNPQADPSTFDSAAEEAFDAVQREALEYAKRFDPDQLHAFFCALYQQREDQWLAGQAFSLLAHLPHPGGLTFLAEVLTSQSEEWRCAVCDKLRELPGEASSALLTRVLLSDEDPDVRWSAADALATVGTENALPVLLHVSVHDRGQDYEGFLVADAAHRAFQAVRRRLQDDTNSVDQ